MTVMVMAIVIVIVIVIAKKSSLSSRSMSVPVHAQNRPQNQLCHALVQRLVVVAALRRIRDDFPNPLPFAYSLRGRVRVG